MKCPNCGYPRAHFKKSRKVHWGGRGKFEEGGHPPRTNFEAVCPKCGWEGKITEVDGYALYEEAEA